MADQESTPSAAHGEAYSRIANIAAQATVGFMSELHKLNVQKFSEEVGGVEGANAAPLIQGVIGGLLQFVLMNSELDDAQARSLLIEAIDESIPQIRLYMATVAAGAVGEGTA